MGRKTRIPFHLCTVVKDKVLCITTNDCDRLVTAACDNCIHDTATPSLSVSLVSVSQSGNCRRLGWRRKAARDKKDHESSLQRGIHRHRIICISYEFIFLGRTHCFCVTPEPHLLIHRQTVTANGCRIPFDCVSST